MNQLIQSKLKSFYIFFLVVLVIANIAQAKSDVSVDNKSESKKSDNNRDYLIDKLHRVVTNIAPSDASRNGIILRLADLLSDRARQNTMLQNEGNCKSCVSPDVDRKKALQYYAEALPKVADSSKAKVLVQMGHLNQLLGNQNQAVEIYSKITNETSDQVARAEAFLAIGEVYFKKSDWKKAQINYEKSIEASNNESKGYAMYRLGWSHFNLGSIPVAKEKLLTILKTPALLSKSGSNENVTDVAFHEQVAKDYSVMCGANFNEADLKNISDYSPEKKKLENLFSVSTELERTAKKKDALVAWNYLYQNQPLPQDRAVTKAHIGTVNLQLSKNVEALKDFNESYSLIGEIKTQFPSEAEDARRLIKSSIITWNQAEKKKPSEELLEAYQGYLKNFGYEKEMSQWAVQIAADLKKWDTAWSIHNAATESVSNGKNGALDFENHLLLGIELGETSKNPVILAEAQNEYLTKSKSKSKYWEVFYQKTYAGYEKAENEDFLKSLSTIVESKEAPVDLRIKSGDLYLDYLASKKKDTEIQTKALEFHKILIGTKGYQSEWAKIGEKSILNQVAADVKENKLDLAWEKIQLFQVKNADSKDVITFFKNKVIIAEKRNDISSAFSAAKDLNAVSGLNKDDKAFAQAKMAYFADLKMDFKSALSFTEQLPETILPADKKNLKLAMYSDLLGQNSAAYLKKFVETTKDQNSKEIAVLEIIKKTAANGNVDDEIKKQEKAIPTSYNILGELAAISYLKNGSKSYGAQMVEKNTEIKKTNFGSMISNDQKLATMVEFNNSVEKMTLDSDITKKDFQKKLVKDIQARAQAFVKLDNMAAEAIKTKDWTLQVVSLNAIAKESDRFYSEILSLPMPDKLSPEEQSEYMRLLGEKAQPYKAKAEQAKTKVNEFWNDSSWQANLSAKLGSNYSALALNEKSELLKIADEKNKIILSNMNSATNMNSSTNTTKLNTSSMAKTNVNINATKNSKIIKNSPETAPESNLPLDIENAKNQVKNEPFNILKIQTLKDLEFKNGNHAMVQYLEGRLNDLNVSNVKSEIKKEVQ